MSAVAVAELVSSEAGEAVEAGAAGGAGEGATPDAAAC